MKNKYILLRHGQTEYQATGSKILYPREDNPTLPITKYGEEQIEKVAKELSFLEVDYVYCSTYHRTRQTAEIVNRKLNKEIVFDERLIDTDFGIFSGKEDIEYVNYFENELEKFMKRTPEGENWNDLKRRTGDVIDEIEKKYENKTILIISHADPLWIIAGYLKGYSDEKMLEERNPDGIWPDVGQYIII